MFDEEITKADFDNVDWQSVTNGVEKKDCDAFSTAFFNKSQDAEDVKAKVVYQLLGHASSMMFTLEDKLHPFGPLWRLSDGTRSAIPDDFSDKELDAFSGIVGDVEEADLQARLADVLWIQKRVYTEGVRAISAYMTSAALMQIADDPLGMIKRMERAIHLALILRIPSVKDILSQFSDTINAWTAKPEPNVIPIHLMKILQSSRLGDATTYSAIAEAEAERCEDVGNWILAGEYWEIKARWAVLNKDDTGRNQAKVRAAETSVKLAEQMSYSAESSLAAAEHLTAAMQALRQVPGMQQRVEQLHPLLLQYQKRGTAVMKMVSLEMDISPFVDKARNAVAGKSLLDALQTLAILCSPHDVALLRKQAEEQAVNSIQAFFPAVRINSEGRRTGQAPALRSDDLEKREAALRGEMLTNGGRAQDLIASGYIAPAIYQITLEHNVRLDDLAPIVSNNPLVPWGREMIYAKGLYAGLSGNFIEAAHLLVPQLENSIRHVLYQVGAIPSGLDAKGIQNEYDLNRTLYMPELKQLLGETSVFDLQGLLVERLGTNFRNNMAHGLYGYDAFSSGRSIYAWGMILRLCFLFRQMSFQQGDDSQEDDASFSNTE